MRFTTIIAAGLFAVTYAQDDATATTVESSTSVASVPTASVSIDPEQQKIVDCLNACNPGDVTCQAKCVSVPNPSEENISANNECISNCPKGNGTEADNLAYQDCQLDCIGQYYYTSTGVPSGASPTDSSDGSDSTGDADSTGTDSADGTSETGSTDDGNAAGVVKVSTAAFSLAAFLAAFVAL